MSTLTDKPSVFEVSKKYIEQAIDDSGGFEYGSSGAAYYTAYGLSLALNIIEEAQRRDKDSN